MASHLLAEESSLLTPFWSGLIVHSLTPASGKEGAHTPGRSSAAARTVTDAWRTDTIPIFTATDVPDRFTILMLLNSTPYY